MFLLRFIPEPWASALLAGVVLVAYIYGSVTGSGTERLKNTVASLEASNKSLTRDLNNAIAIQTAIAQRVSDIRIENKLLSAKGNDLEKQFSAQPNTCTISDADRLRIRSIRIGAKRGAGP